MTDRRIAAAGAVLAALGIGAGAFGAHALRALLGPQALGWWETAVQYQLFGALGLVGLAALGLRLHTSALLIALGVTIFSGSLYAMALTDTRWLGMVVPVGGALMIAGWLLAAWQLLRRG